MEPRIHNSEPLRDVFAAQGIFVVAVGIGMVLLHILAPAFCGELLAALSRIASESPSLETLPERIVAWFASIFGG